MSLLRQGGCRIDAMDVLFFHDDGNVFTFLWKFRAKLQQKNQISKFLTRKIYYARINEFLTAKRWCLHVSATVTSRWDGLPCRCPRRYNISYGALEGTYFPYTLHHTPYTCFICLCLLKGCLPLRGEGSLWQVTVSLLTGRLTERALIAFLTLQPFKRVLFVFFYPLHCSPLIS